MVQDSCSGAVCDFRGDSPDPGFLQWGALRLQAETWASGSGNMVISRGRKPWSGLLEVGLCANLGSDPAAGAAINI